MAPSPLEGVVKGSPLKKLGEYLVHSKPLFAKIKLADQFSADKIGDEGL